MVQGGVGSGLVAAREVRKPVVSDNFAKLSGELASVIGPQNDTDQNAKDKSPFGIPGPPDQDKDPFTNSTRNISFRQKPGATTTVASTTQTRRRDPHRTRRFGPRSGGNVDNVLTAGSKLKKPLHLASDSTGGGGVSSYDMTMTKAEQSLKGGKYLDAAETFQAALGIKPDDPLALVGRAHAEFGAGLYSSAAHDLKFVFIRKPELVSVRYDVASFIPPARQEFLMEDLQKLTDKKDAGDTASFLYCYLCYQTGRTTALQGEFKKWNSRDTHDEWQIVLMRAWVQKAGEMPTSAPAPAR